MWFRLIPIFVKTFYINSIIFHNMLFTWYLDANVIWGINFKIKYPNDPKDNYQAPKAASSIANKSHVNFSGTDVWYFIYSAGSKYCILSCEFISILLINQRPDISNSQPTNAFESCFVAYHVLFIKHIHKSTF